MIKKEKIWNKEKGWFTFKFSLVFLAISVIMLIFSIISYYIFESIVLTFIFGILQAIFFVIFAVPIYMFFNR